MFAMRTAMKRSAYASACWPVSSLLPRVLARRDGIMLGVISAPAGVRERRGREVDLLGGQLALHGVVHVGGTPQQQAASGEQDDAEAGADPAKKLVERSAAHLEHLP